MNTDSDTAGPVARSTTQPMYWSVLRELWENKSIYIAPLIVAAVVLLGALISAGHLPERRRSAMLLDEAHRRAAIELPYDIVAMVIIVTLSLSVSFTVSMLFTASVADAASYFGN